MQLADELSIQSFLVDVSKPAMSRCDPRQKDSRDLVLRLPWLWICAVWSDFNSEPCFPLGQIFWSENGELVCIATEDSLFILKYSAEAVEQAKDDKEKVTEDGIEDAFEVGACI